MISISDSNNSTYLSSTVEGLRAFSLRANFKISLPQFDECRQETQESWVRDKGRLLLMVVMVVMVSAFFGTSSRKPDLPRMTCGRPSALYSLWLESQERILEFPVPESFLLDGKPGCSWLCREISLPSNPVSTPALRSGGSHCLYLLSPFAIKVSL